MYVRPNFKTKKALKEAVALGDTVTLYDPGPFGADSQKEGVTSVEGPYYPKPHTWFAEVTLRDGKVVKVT